ncbi:MAG: EamA/RhaT family transporter [Planctomycetota bacterium]|nr:MAG: EamA/RhaT family transporter [Planctomycetota bacterium]
MDARAARLQVLAAAALFSTGGAAIKACHLSSWQVASLRSGIAAVALLLLVPQARHGFRWRTLPVALAYAATLILFVTATKLTTAANAIFLQSTAPLYLLLLGPWLLHERVRARDLAYMLAVGAGLTLVFLGDTGAQATAPDPGRGNLLALASGVTYALVLLGFRWLGTRPDAGPGDAAAAAVAGNALAWIIGLPWALPVTESTPADWAVLAFLGVVQIGLAYKFLTAGMRSVPAFEASLLVLVEPVLNPVWTWMVHGEVPGLGAVAGGVVILAATALKTGSDLRRAPAA